MNKFIVLATQCLNGRAHNITYNNFGSGQLVNHISYADDMCLLSFSTAGMQKLLNICDQYSNDHDLIYNSKKTMCMRFTPKSCKSYECKLSLNQESLSYVREARYLGVVIQSSGTDKDVHRQMRKYYAGINTLILRFYTCSYDVKCYLFRSYISNMYCGQFWFNSTTSLVMQRHILISIVTLKALQTKFN